jgi:hypothetical protein
MINSKANQIGITIFIYTKVTHPISGFEVKGGLSNVSLAKHGVLFSINTLLDKIWVST